MTEALALEHLREWIGRTEQTQDDLSPWTANAMAALLRNAQRPRPAGHALPPLWHWSYFLPTVPQDGLGTDGAGPVPAPQRPGLPCEWQPRMDAVPALGEHTEAILAVIGDDAADISTLREQRVI